MPKGVVTNMRYGWSLDSHDWAGATACIQALNWHRVRLSADHRDSVPAAPGVYLMCASGFPLIEGRVELYNAVYVGQSRSLRQRFLTHCTHPSPEVRRAKECFGAGLHYWYTRLTLDRLDEVERLLISVFGPSANMVNGVRARIGDPRPAGS